MMKSRANRDELFEADDHSVSWADHQVWRIERLMRLESERLEVPTSALRLAYESRQIFELMNRDGKRVSYRAQGLIEKVEIPERSNQTVTFQVCWVDPWGFFHTDVVNFFEVRLKVMDEFSFRRLKRLALEAREAMKIPTNS
jgi:hypothetical protein